MGHAGRLRETNWALSPVRVYTKMALAFSLPATMAAELQISSAINLLGSFDSCGYVMAPKFSRLTQSSTSVDT